MDPAASFYLPGLGWRSRIQRLPLELALGLQLLGLHWRQQGQGPRRNRIRGPQRQAERWPLQLLKAGQSGVQSELQTQTLRVQPLEQLGQQSPQRGAHQMQALRFLPQGEHQKVW